MQSDVRNTPPASELDDDTFEFANAVFDLARAGDSETLGALLGKGLPPNLRNHRGDSLLMLAAYHGHLETVRVLLQHRSDPVVDRGDVRPHPDRRVSGQPRRQSRRYRCIGRQCGRCGPTDGRLESAGAFAGIEVSVAQRALIWFEPVRTGLEPGLNARDSPQLLMFALSRPPGSFIRFT